MHILARSAVVLGFLTLGFTPLFAAAPVAAAEATTVATRFGDATFEPGRSAIVVPYTGAAPRPTLYTLSGSHHYYDFSGARLAKPAVQFRRVGGAIERFTLADRAGSAVRVSFQLTQNAKPTIQIDPARRQIVIFPLGKAVRATAPIRATAPSRPTPKATPKVQPAPKVKPKPKPRPVATPRPVAPRASAAPQSSLPGRDVRVPTGLTPPTQRNELKTEVGKPYFDDVNHRLVLPYKGLEPDFNVVVYYKNPRWVYFDFSNAYITAEGQRFETFVSNPAFEGWMLSQRKGGLKTRLYLKLRAPGQVVAQVRDESHQIWLEVPGRHPAAPQPPAAPDAGDDPSPTDD